MSDRLRVAVVGLGVGFQHLSAYRELPDLFELAAVCDPVAAKRDLATGLLALVGLYVAVRFVLGDASGWLFAAAVIGPPLFIVTSLSAVTLNLCSRRSAVIFQVAPASSLNPCR